jgi:hypothetical protein
MRPRAAALLTRNPTKDFYPERPSGVKDLSSTRVSISIRHCPHSSPENAAPFVFQELDPRLHPTTPLGSTLTEVFILNNSKLLRMNPYKEQAVRAPFAPFWCNLSPFRINTYRNVRKCCKQKTYAPAKPFRCNTYKKPGAGAVGSESSSLPFNFQLSTVSLLCPALHGSRTTDHDRRFPARSILWVAL